MYASWPTITCSITEYAGLEETLDTLTASGLKVAGAGRNLYGGAPACHHRPAKCRPGARVCLRDPVERHTARLGRHPRLPRGPPFWRTSHGPRPIGSIQRVGQLRCRGDIVVASIHGAATGVMRYHALTFNLPIGRSTEASILCTDIPPIIPDLSRCTARNWCCTVRRLHRRLRRNHWIRRVQERSRGDVPPGLSIRAVANSSGSA